jgi:hypothetical protein
VTPQELIIRVKSRHPIQYGFLGKLMIVNTENVVDERMTERFNRCPVCEQWSPCDVREVADLLEQEMALADDIMDVLAHMVIGWEDQLGVDLAQHPEVLRVAERYRAMRGRPQ